MIFRMKCFHAEFSAGDIASHLKFDVSSASPPRLRLSSPNKIQTKSMFYSLLEGKTKNTLHLCPICRCNKLRVKKLLPPK